MKKVLLFFLTFYGAVCAQQKTQSILDRLLDEGNRADQYSLFISNYTIFQDYKKDKSLSEKERLAKSDYSKAKQFLIELIPHNEKDQQFFAGDFIKEANFTGKTMLLRRSYGIPDNDASKMIKDALYILEKDSDLAKLKASNELIRSVHTAGSASINIAADIVYFYRLNDEGLVLVNDFYARLNDLYEIWENWHQQDYVMNIGLQKLLALYYIETDASEKTEALLNNNQSLRDGFLSDLFYIKKIDKASSEEEYQAMREHVDYFINRDFMKESPAQAQFELAMRLLSTDNKHPYKSLDNVQTNQKAVMKGVKLLEDLGEQSPFLRALVLYNQAMVFLRQGQSFKAQLLLRQSLDLSYRSDTVYALALIYLQNQQYEDAYPLLIEASYILPDNEELLNNLAWSEAQTGRFDDSIFRINALVRENPRDFRFLNTRSQILWLQNKPNEAVRDARAAKNLLLSINTPEYRKYLPVFQLSQTNNLPFIIEENINDIDERIAQWQNSQ